MFLKYPPHCLNYQPAFLSTLLNAKPTYTNFGAPRIPSNNNPPSNEFLPAFQMKNKILNAIEEHPVVVITGETGCGKTTQVPQYIFNYCARYKQPCQLICALPRRMATKQAAAQVSRELGQCVDYQVRFEKQIQNASIIFMTR